MVWGRCTCLACISHAAMTQRPPRKSAAMKPAGEGFETAIEERGLDTVSPSPGRAQQLPYAHDAKNWQGKKLLTMRNQMAPAPSDCEITKATLYFKLQPAGTKVPAVQLLRDARSCAIKALISPLFCASTE